MKTKIFKVLIVTGLVIAGLTTFTLTSVSAKSIYDEFSLETETLTIDEEYSLEEMLNYAIQDEFMAQAEYQAIIAEFGDIMPFARILEAEGTHIEMLLQLFEAYGYEVPENNSASSVVIPESITSALATGAEAEEANIAMYQTFLAQENLPEDVRTVFESLVKASEHHLAAFSGERYSYYGTDIMNQIKNQWRKMFKDGSSDNGNQYQGSNGSQKQSSSGNCNR